MKTQSFQPDWVSAPGSTIASLLEKNKISSQNFINLLGENEGYVIGLLLGQSEINENIAVKLADLLGGSASFWQKREHQYRSELARLSETLSNTEADDWLKSISARDLVRKGWITLRPRENIVEACLRFFGVPTISEWREKYFGSLALAAFRKSPSFALSLAPTATWFRRCELLATHEKLESWSPENFSAQLAGIRELVRVKKPMDFFPLLKEACSSAGVAVVVEEAPKGCPASGATRILESGKPTIMLSLRHKTDDHFWFTFFHEAGHLILHQNRINLDLTETTGETTTDIEREANLFSERILIPEELELEFNSINYNTKRTGEDILRFARKANLTPGIVVGQLQFRRGLSWKRLNTYKRHFDFEEFA